MAVLDPPRQLRPGRGRCQPAGHREEVPVGEVQGAWPELLDEPVPERLLGHRARVEDGGEDPAGPAHHEGDDADLWEPAPGRGREPLGDPVRGRCVEHRPVRGRHHQPEHAQAQDLRARVSQLGAGFEHRA